MQRNDARDYLQLHLVVLAWGLTAILGKLITLPPAEVVLWRTSLAALGFGFIARARRFKLAVDWRRRLGMLGVGAVLGLHWVLFFWSARLGTVSVCLAVMPTAMLWCSVIEPLIDGTRRWRLSEIVVGIVMVGAVWLIYKVEFRYWQGFTVAIFAALLAAIFAVFSKQQVAAGLHWSVVGTHQMTGAFFAALLAGTLIGDRFEPVLPDAASVLWIFLLAIVCTVAAYAGFMDVLQRVSVFTVNVVYNMEPVYGIVLATLVFGRAEFMSAGFYAGAAVIISVVLALPWLRRWVEK